MRSYEDVKKNLKTYEKELQKELKARTHHYVVVGGNMCVIQKKDQRVLGKGIPVPLNAPTAQYYIKKFQPLCCDDIELKRIKYSEWLENAIKECNQLTEYVQEQTNCQFENSCGTVSVQPSRQEQIDTSSPEQEKQNNDDMTNTIEITNKNDQYCMRSAQITICSPFCPFNINTCICCKFFVGIDVDCPQSIKCSYSEPKNPKKI